MNNNKLSARPLIQRGTVSTVPGIVDLLQYSSEDMDRSTPILLVLCLVSVFTLLSGVSLTVVQGEHDNPLQAIQYHKASMKIGWYSVGR